MARMIPAQVAEGTKSDAERKLFPRLKKMPDTENWTILHSVNIANHETQMQGETDFMVFIPGQPVLLLEVKGGEVSCDDDGWYSIDRNNVTHDLDPDPIDEANNAMQSVISHLKRRGAPVELQRTLFGFGVMFPDTTYHGVITSLEIADEQVADYDDCLTPEDLKKYVLKLAAHWKKNKPRMLHMPTAAQCSELIRWIRPNFTGKVSLKSLIHTVEQQVYELTEQQKAAFETISGNDRCLVVGEAGTGKTLIATDFAQDKSEEGLHIGFFCYNRFLGNHLKNSVAGRPTVESGSFTMYMEEVVKKAGLSPGEIEDPDEKRTYFLTELPKLFMDAFLELELPAFDVLILDEAQDLMTEEYLAAMDLILEGGLQNGSWYFFMDAERQNLFRTDVTEADVKKLLKKYNAFYTQSVLKENCRNSAAIIEKIDAVFDMETQYKARDERGAEVKIRSFKNMQDQNDALRKVLQELTEEGVQYDQIVILSPFKVENSAAGHIPDLPISTDPEDREGKLFCGTIQAFKGLESPVVILTNVVDTTRDSMRDLLYVGMTRAKSLLYILAADSVVKEIQ